MAQQSIQIEENEQALKYLKESLKFSPNDLETLSFQAKLYMKMNLMDQCKEVCKLMFQLDSHNEPASVIMADLSFRKMEFESAAFHFSQVLHSQPTHWIALARLIEILRRTGKLVDAKIFLENAKLKSANLLSTFGLHYCIGLYERYNGNLNESLRNFNTARRDPEWGQQAISNMIQICISPDDDLPNSSDLYEGVENIDLNDSRNIALHTADRLFKELYVKQTAMANERVNKKLIYNFIQISTKQKYKVETALQNFTELSLMQECQNMVGPLLGVATAYILLKQTHKAKVQLKRAARIPWSFEEAEYLERTWLLLADIYINTSKLDEANTYIQLVLKYNKSSIKGYEFAGVIAEKHQSLYNTVNYYQKAWEYGGKSNPLIGYKLAYTFMKLKQYADAINICQQVIKVHPDCISIRKDIYEKCRLNLKV